jgi:hypothetical protein
MGSNHRNVKGKMMSSESTKHSIGTLGEKTLHNAIKHYIEPDISKHEVKKGAFIADIINDSGIYEIQTRAFNKLRKKLAKFLETDLVTVVYPLPKSKWIIWINEQTGEITNKRKSPKQGTIFDAVSELYRIKQQLTHPNQRLRIVFIDMEEYRLLDGWSKDKKKGSTRYDRIPQNIIEELFFNTTSDYVQFIPDSLQNDFTSKDYKDAAKINMRTSQTALNILNYLGVVKRVGKQGNLYVYKRSV